MRETYWKEEDGIWYFNISCPEERYVLDFNNQSIKRQFNYLGDWEDSNFDLISFPPTLSEAKWLIENDFKNSEIAQQEWEQEMWHEIAQEENKRLEERDSWKKKLKGLINTKRLWEDMDDNDYWGIEGIVEVEVSSDREGVWTANMECARIKDEKGYLYTRNDPDYGVKYINHYYVWQTVGFAGDDYSGYLLYPLKDGKYLKISYSC